MVKILAMEVTKKLNFFPPKGGISPYYSPRMILHQENLEYNKHCAIAFGTFVQARQEPSILNSQSPRTLDCVYLRYVDNLQGGHHLLDLHTGQTIKRRTVTPVPITQNAIELVNDMADHDGIANGLKIETRSGKILFDSAWIAEVDYEDYDENDDEVSIIEIENNDDHEEMDLNEIAEILQEPVEANTEEIEENNIDDNASSNPTEDEVEDNNEEEIEDNNEDEVEIECEQDDDEEQNEDVPDEEEIVNNYVTRTGRISRPPEKLSLLQCHLQTQGHKETEYGIETAKMIATQIVSMNEKYSFVETYSSNKGLMKFGERCHNAAFPAGY
jgi:hypothetical protein